ncbi:allophanate hydrolase subunit 1 [Amycolatopsis minnesotensis]|uniref:Allophanate hydrolase subunit 1 n=1 Tax=Amycolatopsis minnesotensis TaxID=337894 RepID=A0ABP5DKL0_9PSEU
MQVVPYGERAALVDLDDAGEVVGLRAALSASPLSGVDELVAGARTLLVRFDPARTSFDRVRAAVHDRESGTGPTPGGPSIVVPVSYDGADLAAVAEASGLSVPEVVRRHSAATYTVAFCGFAPGYGYLTGLDPRLHLPRRAAPRTRVPAGSVAIAGEYSAVYPHQSPGGWHLLGRTPLAVWDADREPPNLLSPGTRVEFRVRS